MEQLYDFLPIYIGENSIYELFIEIIREENEQDNIYIIKDNFIKDENRINDMLSNCKFTLINKYINRSNCDLTEIKEIINDYDMYTCFNNGLSIPCNISSNSRTFLYNLYPLFKKDIVNKEYSIRYNKAFDNIKKCNSTVVVCSNYHYNLALAKGIKVDNLQVYYPYLPQDYKEIDKKLGILYIKSKFGIGYKYFLAMGSCNESFNLEGIIDFYKEFNDNSVKIIFLMNYTSIDKLMKFREIVAEKIDGTVIFNFTKLDEINFIAASEAIIDFSSEFIVNLTKIKGLIMNKALITDLNKLNLEYFEDYPIYYSNEKIYLEDIYTKENEYEEYLKFNIKGKFTK